MLRRGSLFVASLLLTLCSAACGWNPKAPFDREAPPVKEAIALLGDAGGDAATAVSGLEEYLSTGACADGVIGTPEPVRKRADGTFDLGLALFRVGEAFGRKFGDEEIDAGVTEAQRASRHAQVECAIRLLSVVLQDESRAPDLRAEAHYLEGNLQFLDGQYEEAVRSYDAALAIFPGIADAGAEVGRNAAYNRAIALRRIDDDKNKDAGHDASNDSAQPDSGPGDGGGGQNDAGKDQKEDAASPKSPPDAGNDQGKDAGQDASGDNSKPEAGEPPTEPDAGRPPPSIGQDDRVLDMLENSAPTVQQEEAKQRAGKRHVKGSADR